MLAVQLIKSQIATVKDLGKLLFLQSIVPVTLKNTEKMVFAALMATVKVLDKSIIRCTLREFCRELARLGVAHTSPDTIRRALLKLEALGYCEVDRRRDGLSIRINLKAMTSWTSTKTSNVIPLPTSISIPYIDTQIHTKEHNSYPLANCEVDLGREINSRVNSCNSCSYPTRAKQDQDKYTKWLHPILFTLSMILKGAPDRDKILAKSDIELRALSAGIELTHPSGVPWEHYASHWQELDPRAGGPREMIARNEIIPVLRGITPVKPRAMELQPVEKCEDTYSEVSPEDRAGIRAKIREYLEQNSGIQPIEPNNIRSEHLPPNEIDETDPEMKILIEARDRTRARRINDS